MVDDANPRSKAWLRKTKVYLDSFTDNNPGTVTQYVKDHVYNSAGRMKQCLFLAHVLDDLLRSVSWKKRGMQMLLRRIAALELLDEVESNDWEVVRAISYPLTTKAIGVDDLRTANKIAKARERISKRFKGDKSTRSGKSGRGAGNSSYKSSNNANNNKSKNNDNKKTGGGGRRSS